ncbi:recombinase family protein [Streptomyces mirabilis]|uniref:recombinase family protein n=1 Tax=Streptomyces mirabilis TaxID=68239 RepID=UPI00365C07E8
MREPARSNTPIQQGRRDRQIKALNAVSCRRTFADRKSGENDLRPELRACHALLSRGDTLVVPALGRYGRSLQDLVSMVAELRERGIGFQSLHEALDTTTPRRAPDLPRLRRTRRVHPRTHRRLAARPGQLVDLRMIRELAMDSDLWFDNHWIVDSTPVP